MSRPAVALEHILQLAASFGPDDKGRYMIGKMNATMMAEGFTGPEWGAGIKLGEATGKLKMDPMGSGAFFVIPKEAAH
jgi:hypothetical protein